MSEWDCRHLDGADYWRIIVGKRCNFIQESKEEILEGNERTSLINVGGRMSGRRKRMCLQCLRQRKNSVVRLQVGGG